MKREGELRSPEDLDEAIRHGEVKRLRPKMITVSAGENLLPDGKRIVGNGMVWQNKYTAHVGWASVLGPNSLCSDQQTQGQESLVVTISDTGVGIAKEDLDLIFKPFHTTRAEGTGLGLAIVKRILEAHRGSIVARSLPGAGSSFSVWLPSTK